MKKSIVQKKKLTKRAMKEISGSGPVCPLVISCTDKYTGEERYGVHGFQDGPCC